MKLLDWITGLWNKFLDWLVGPGPKGAERAEAEKPKEDEPR